MVLAEFHQQYVSPTPGPLPSEEVEKGQNFLPQTKSYGTNIVLWQGRGDSQAYWPTVSALSHAGKCKSTDLGAWLRGVQS